MRRREERLDREDMELNFILGGVVDDGVGFLVLFDVLVILVWIY